MRWEDVVAANLKRLRKERELTQEQLAFEAGVAVRYIRMIERGSTSATVGMLGKLGVALSVHPSEFLRSGENGAAADIDPLARDQRP